MPDVTARATRYVDRLPKPADFYGADTPEGLIRDLLKRILSDGYEDFECALADMEEERDDFEARVELVSGRLAKLCGMLGAKPDASIEDVFALAKTLVAGTH